MAQRLRLAHAVTFAATLAASLTARGARADVCPAPDDAPGVGKVDAQVRLDFLAHAFDREVSDIDAWSWGWGSVYVAGTIVQAVALVPTTDHGKRIDLEVGAISTTVGALSLTVLPLQLTLPLRSARSHWGDADKCAVLARAEHTLASVEKDQALANSIVGHIGNVAVNLGIALILGVGYHQWSSAAISGGVGVAIGEANAFTQPHHLHDVLMRYRTGRFDGPDAPPLSVAWSVAPVVSPQMSGLKLAVTW
jgi:hypothetical protein